MNFEEIKRKAEGLFKKRGGSDDFRGATDERTAPTGEGSLTQKAEEAEAALRNPGAVGPDPKP